MMDHTMQRAGILACLAAFAGILFSTPLCAAADLQQYADGFRSIKIAPGLAKGPNLIDVIMPFLDGFPEGTEGNQSIEMRIGRKDAGYSVEIDLSGYLDDAISGERYRGFVIPAGDGWELLEMSVKPDCWRGEAVDGRCP